MVLNTSTPCSMRLVFLCVCTSLVLIAVHAQQQPINPPAQPSNDYKYTQGGDDWSGLCKSGKSQSPIDLPFSPPKTTFFETKGSKVQLDLHYHLLKTEQDTCKGAVNVSLVHTGNALELAGNFGFVTYGEGCCQSVYLVKQIQFRAPAEHTLDGRAYDMELQIIHQKEGSKGNENLLGVSILFELKSTPGGNHFLQSIEWSYAPQHNGEQHLIHNCVDLNTLSYSLDGDYYAYSGSLTYPSCDENMPWNVMVKSQGISKSELAVLSNLFQNNNNFASGHGNNRKIQPTNNREVLYVVRHPLSNQHEFETNSVSRV